MSHHISNRNERTLAKTVAVSGKGYWSSRDVRVEFHPAEARSGVRFVRTDLPQPIMIPALLENRINAPRRTTLAKENATVEMVEHILAALAGLRIDNCEIRVNAAEMPGSDGSSREFVEAILSAGVVEQPAARQVLVVNEVTRVGDENEWVEARPAATPAFHLKYRLDYGMESPIHKQTITLKVTPESFQDELASARTFLLKAEADWLRSQGLGAHVTEQDLLIFDDMGVIGNTLRYEDECVRHKTLDMVGDLSLAGCDFVGSFTAYRSGHRLNAELVRALLAEHSLPQEWRDSA